MPKKIGTEEWVERARIVHGDQYDYGKTIYKSAREKVSIKCRHHGSFLQAPYSHIAGHGCPQCKRERLSSLKQKSLEDFLESAAKVHGNRYDYTSTIYSKAHDDVKIACRLHGSFRQRATNHLSGAGCPKCGRDIVENSIKVPFQEFKRRASLMHDSVYEYDSQSYEGMNSKCVIRCHKHGIFSQVAASHLSGSGCPKCGAQRIAEYKLSNTEDFVRKASIVHGGVYDYSASQYRSAKENVEIICSIHGSFFQTPNSHLGGKGCSGCGKYGFRQDKKALFYYARINRAHLNPLWMVGITNRSFQERYPAEDRLKMSLLHVEAFDSGADALALETRILRRYRASVYSGLSPLKGKGRGSGKSNEIFSEDVLGLDDDYSKS